MHDRARELELDRLGDAGSRVGDGHLRAGIAPQLLGDLVDLPTHGRHPVDSDDPVALTHAGFVGWCVRKNALHADGRTWLLLEQHAGAAVPTVSAAVEGVALLR